MTQRTAISRAHTMTQADGKTRWVNWTSLGWRIEFAPCIGVPSIRITFHKGSN